MPPKTSIKQAYVDLLGTKKPHSLLRAVVLRFVFGGARGLCESVESGNVETRYEKVDVVGAFVGNH
jgi:hypothetical protein